ncbi:MAG: hypothetical protein LBU14_05135 [Candidatus Peribacteria bacterium]|nr:hypothetical protein [Candidatus Peribacteria bacterium]
MIFTDLPDTTTSMGEKDDQMEQKEVKYLVKVKDIFNWSSLDELFQDKDSLVKIFPYD